MRTIISITLVCLHPYVGGRSELRQSLPISTIGRRWHPWHNREPDGGATAGGSDSAHDNSRVQSPPIMKRVEQEVIDIEHVTSTKFNSEHFDIICHGTFMTTGGLNLTGDPGIKEEHSWRSNHPLESGQIAALALYRRGLGGHRKGPPHTRAVHGGRVSRWWQEEISDPPPGRGVPLPNTGAQGRSAVPTWGAHIRLGEHRSVDRRDRRRATRRGCGRVAPPRHVTLMPGRHRSSRAAKRRR